MVRVMILGKIASSMAAVSVFVFASSLPANSQQNAASSELLFHSSDPKLNQSFDWAKQQALAYVRPASSSIGEWYEAALPGRNAFCMRDVSHQATGAAVLGLFSANRNMLGRFADAVSSTRNWAGYWEIDGNGNPSTEDYVSDADFWYNLPANFDVLDAIVRMWRWTGDNSYRDDPRIQQFFRGSLTDYLQQWQLAPEDILKRPRIVNQLQKEGKFVESRGIPSYIEGPRNFILGTDLLAAEYRALRSYREIAVTHDDKVLAARLQTVADRIQRILETVAWSSRSGHFNGYLFKDLNGSGSGDTLALYFDAVKDPVKVQRALAYISDPAYWKKINIEEESYVPGVLFRYGQSDVAYPVLFDLSASDKPRREYPEVSYAVVSAIVSGAMGIEPSQAGEDFDVETLAQPLSRAEVLSVKSLQIRGNLVNVMHNGEASTRFENLRGPAIRWRATFKGGVDFLYVNGRAQRASRGTLGGRARISWIDVAVPPGATVRVSRRERADKIHE